MYLLGSCPLLCILHAHLCLPCHPSPAVDHPEGLLNNGSYGTQFGGKSRPVKGRGACAPQDGKYDEWRSSLSICQRSHSCTK